MRERGRRKHKETKTQRTHKGFMGEGWRGALRGCWLQPSVVVGVRGPQGMAMPNTFGWTSHKKVCPLCPLCPYWPHRFSIDAPYGRHPRVRGPGVSGDRGVRFGHYCHPRRICYCETTYSTLAG